MNDQAPNDQQPEQPKRTDRDWFLQQLVKMANRSAGTGGVFGVTLCVKGVMVSGVIASGRGYFESFAENVTDAMEDDPEIGAAMQQQIHDYFAGIGQKLYPPRRAGADKSAESAPDAGEQDADDDDQKQPPEFIHLRDARIISGTQVTPTNDGIWWRGRISEVDGWFLGTLGQDQS